MRVSGLHPAMFILQKPLQTAHFDHASVNNTVLPKQLVRLMEPRDHTEIKLNIVYLKVNMQKNDPI